MLVSLLRAEAVPLATLQARYGSLLQLVKKLIGVVPNCDQYLEIWPPAFRTYNVMVPNLLNLPFMLWGVGAPRDLLGLAMYASSRTASCAYCSAHTCSFALRRGAAPDKVRHATDEDLGSHTPAERASIEIARALSRVPADVTDAQRNALRRELSRANAEWVVLGVAMMGFLNEWMDAMGVELEPETAGEVNSVIAGAGWSPGKHLAGDAPPAREPPRPDSMFTRISVLREAPSAIALDKRWTAGVPDRWPDAGDYLVARGAPRFSVLSQLSHARAIRGIASMVRESFDPEHSVVGIPAKRAAGVIYAETIGNHDLAAELDTSGKWAADERIEALAKAIAPSPANVDDGVVEACRSLSPSAIVEVVTFVSVMQLVHRVQAFFHAT